MQSLLAHVIYSSIFVAIVTSEIHRCIKLGAAKVHLKMIQYILQYAFILVLHYQSMQKMLLLLPTILMMGAILVTIPNVSAVRHHPPPPQPRIAKPCQASASIQGSDDSIKSSGSCSIAGSEHGQSSPITAQGTLIVSGGSRSSCSAASMNVAGPNAESQSSSGAVSCGSHSP